MNATLDTIKPAVRDLKAYSLRPDRASVKINQNENPWDAPTRIKEETLRRMAQRKWSRYPDFMAASLQEKLADFAGWKSEGVIAGNGSNELIQALLMVTVGEGKRVVICEPTFALYRQISRVLGGEVISAPLSRELTYNVSAIQDAIKMFGPDVTIICSPNNPTGCVIGDGDLAALCEISRGLVVVDEAYHEFAEHSVVPLLRDHRNLVVLRTFSKAMAMAGLRVGYLLAAPELVQEIRKAVLPYNLNAFSRTAAEVAVEMYQSELASLIKKIIGERARLVTDVERIDGLKPVDSRANFFVVGSSVAPATVFGELLRRDILVRDVSGYLMLKDYFRVSVGTPEENDRLVGALLEIFQ